MPLLTSPLDGVAMRQIRRYGIELDVCPLRVAYGSTRA